MGTGKILPTLVTLGLPAAAGGVMQTLFEVADTLFVSRLGKEQISGVGLIGPVMFTAFAVSQAVNVGIAASVSRHLGAKEPNKARDIVNHGLVISLVVGAALTLLLGSACFVALALLLAGTLRAEAALAVANLVWVLLLGLGLLAPTESLPGILAPVAAALPSGALGDAMRLALVGGGWPLAQWAVLAVWGVGAAVLASRTFRWSD